MARDPACLRAGDAFGSDPVNGSDVLLGDKRNLAAVAGYQKLIGGGVDSEAASGTNADRRELVADVDLAHPVGVRDRLRNVDGVGVADDVVGDAVLEGALRDRVRLLAEVDKVANDACPAPISHKPRRSPFGSLRLPSATWRASLARSAVSPDGTQVAVYAGRGDEALSGFIAVIQLTDPFTYTTIAPRTETDQWFPFAWTQQGLFALHRSCSAEDWQECSLAIELLDPGSGATVRTLQAELPTGANAFGEPALSPDGTTLGWGILEGLYLGPVEGELQQLTDSLNPNTLSLGTAP